MLSDKQLNDVCLLHQDHGQCRYLDEDPRTWQYHCMKHRKVRKDDIDEKVSDFLIECKKKGVDPDSQGFPMGDNCSGFPVLKHIQQGYDV